MTSLERMSREEINGTEDMLEHMEAVCDEGERTDGVAWCGRFEAARDEEKVRTDDELDEEESGID